jgi:hypothetical protein
LRFSCVSKCALLGGTLGEFQSGQSRRFNPKTISKQCPTTPPDFPGTNIFPARFVSFYDCPGKHGGAPPGPLQIFSLSSTTNCLSGGAAPRSIGAKLCRDRSPSPIICISAFSSCLTYIRFGAGKNSFFLNLASRFFCRPLSPATHSFALAFGINVVLGRK